MQEATWFVHSTDTTWCPDQTIWGFLCMARWIRQLLSWISHPSIQEASGFVQSTDTAWWKFNFQAGTSYFGINIGKIQKRLFLKCNAIRETRELHFKKSRFCILPIFIPKLDVPAWKLKKKITRLHCIYENVVEAWYHFGIQLNRDVVQCLKRTLFMEESIWVFHEMAIWGREYHTSRYCTWDSGKKGTLMYCLTLRQLLFGLSSTGGAPAQIQLSQNHTTWKPLPLCLAWRMFTLLEH